MLAAVLANSLAVSNGILGVLRGFHVKQSGHGHFAFCGVTFGCAFAFTFRLSRFHPFETIPDVRLDHTRGDYGLFRALWLAWDGQEGELVH